MTTLPRSRPWTRTDLDQMPDDGHRYELVDGAVVVTPPPRPRHQFVVDNLLVLLKAASPPDLTVVTGPIDVALGEDTVLQPDLLVARRSDFTDRDLPVAPRLAVEVLSPSTRLIDLTLKRARYQAAGCPSYWVVDPDEPSLIAWGLQGSEYVERAHVTSDETFTTELPFPVSVTPSRLVD